MLYRIFLEGLNWRLYWYMYVNHIITVFFNIYSMYFYVGVLFGVYNFTKEFSTHCDSSERLKIVIYTNDLLTHGRRAVKVFLAGHTYCDTRVWQWSCPFLFERLRYVPTWDRTPISLMRVERSSPTTTRRFNVYRKDKYYIWI